jgi:hypothetical protein
MLHENMPLLVSPKPATKPMKAGTAV